MVVPVSGRSSVTVITVSRLLPVSVHPLGNPDGNMDRHGFILIGVKIPYSIKPRRAGDAATCYSDATKAKKELGWEAEYDIKDMCADSWNFQQKNPNGYED